MVAAPALARDATAVYAPLLERGISRRVLSYFAVTLCTRRGYPYWRYPIRGAEGPVIAWRYKRAGDDTNRPKYEWGTEREPDPVWPSRPGPAARADAVYNIVAVQPGRPAIVCAGEPDVWLLTSLGARACSFLAGEGAAPEAAVQALRARAPRHLVVLYDHDETGRRGARTLVRRLRDGGTPALARRLPDALGPGGDVTDLYQACRQDRARFCAAVRALPCLEIPARAALPRLPADLPAYRAAGDSPIAHFKATHPLAAAIEAAGVALTPHQGGSYLQGRCPFHDDRDPSLVVWPERGYWKCFGCQARGDVLDFLAATERACPLRGVSA